MDLLLSYDLCRFFSVFFFFFFIFSCLLYSSYPSVFT